MTQAEWDELNKGSQSKAPNTQLVAFVARHFEKRPNHPGISFLDIGPGKHGANQTWFGNMDFDVLSVDISKEARKNIQDDIRYVDFPTCSFDLVYDINTLCHVDPYPIERIHQWLKPHGRFYSIAPTDDTWKGVGEGKSFTRFATLEQIETMHDCFTGLYRSRISQPRGDHQINSWIVEAMK